MGYDEQSNCGLVFMDPAVPWGRQVIHCHWHVVRHVIIAVKERTMCFEYSWQGGDLTHKVEQIRDDFMKK